MLTFWYHHTSINVCYNSSMKKNSFCEFARVELYKERCRGVKQADQCDAMNMSVHTIRNFMLGYYNEHPLSKIIEYFIEKGGVILCPSESVQFSSGSKQ